MSSKTDFGMKLITEQAMIGRVITQSTAIENIINAYIAEFYTRCPNADYQAIYLAFMYDLMNERGISLDTKINILFKIFERMLTKEDRPSRSVFINWIKVRNKFAHGNYIADSGILYLGEFFDVNELADAHATLQQRINAELEKLAELRGPYFNHFPTRK